MEQIADFFTNLMLKYDVIAERDKKIYAYGIRAMILKIIFTSILFLVAFMIHEIFYTIIFYISYKEIRGIYGKFHSKSRISCFWWTALICFLSYFMKLQVLDYIPLYLLVILLSFIFLMLTLIKNARDQDHMLQAGSTILYFTFLILYVLGFEAVAYGIFMGFFCTALLECFYYVPFILREENRKF